MTGPTRAPDPSAAVAATTRATTPLATNGDGRPQGSIPNDAASQAQGAGQLHAPDTGAAPHAPGSGQAGAPNLSAGPAPRSGSHGAMDATDAWFEHELSLLESHSRTQAAAWAAAGLPRLDVGDEALDVEIALEKRGLELFRRWIERARSAVEDAIHETLRRAGGELVALRVHAAGLGRLLSERDDGARDLERISAEKKDREVTFGFQPFMGRGWFWALILLLVFVDLVANVPVFQELLPHEPGSELRWQELSARAERFGLWAGFYRVIARLTFAPDVTLLALGVIAFLVFSAHVFGEAMRQRTALREDDLPAARIGIRAHRRQWVFPLLGGAGAALLVIFFLFSSRIIIEQSARDRLEEATTRVTTLEGALAEAKAAGNLDAIADLETRLPAARSVREEREGRLRYATAIAAMNVPILILNLVLALAAALASFLAKEASVTDGRPVDPRQLAAEERLDRLREHVRVEREAIGTTVGRVRTDLARARQLTGVRPLGDWEARAERLRGVIPLFRAENARLRGVDPANIAAFSREPTLALPPVEADTTVPEPQELLRHEAEFERLEAQLASIEGPPHEPAMLEATA